MWCSSAAAGQGIAGAASQARYGIELELLKSQKEKLHTDYADTRTKYETYLRLKSELDDITVALQSQTALRARFAIKVATVSSTETDTTKLALKAVHAEITTGV